MQTTMHSLQRLLWTFILVIRPTVYAFLFNDHGNVSSGHPDHDNYNIYSKIDALEKNLQIMETSFREKTTHMDTLMRQALLTVNEMDAKIETIYDLRNKTLEIDKYFDLFKNHSDTPVGFTTKIYGRYSNGLAHIQGHGILFNKGNAYNERDFTCPSSGLYLFLVTLYTTDADDGVWIYKNSQKLTVAWSGGNPGNNGASTVAVTWLNLGDQVYLRPHKALYIDPESIFGGVKIY